MILDEPWILFFELGLSSDDFLHKFGEFVVSWVVDVGGVVRNDLVLVFWEGLLSRCVIDAYDSETLAGGLCGADGTIVHVLFFDVDDILSLLVLVRLVLAAMLASPLRILLRPHSLARVVVDRRNIPRRTHRTDHGFSSIGNSIG